MRKNFFFLLLSFSIFEASAETCVDRTLGRLLSEDTALSSLPSSVPGRQITIDLASLKTTYPEIENTLSGIEGHIKTAPLIASPSEIPFNLSSGFRPASSQSMIERASQLDPIVARSITKAYNQLNTPEHVENYLKNLHEEASLWMARKGRPEDIERLQRGVVTEQAIVVVVTQRLKQRGDNAFTTIQPNAEKNISFGSQNIDPQTINTDNDAFRAAVRTGPFYDRAFKPGSRYGHGPYTHLLQRDMIHGVVNEATNNNPEVFWEFLGSKKGINWWADLFDSGNDNSVTKPETLNQIIQHSMLDRVPVE